MENNAEKIVKLLCDLSIYSIILRKGGISAEKIYKGRMKTLQTSSVHN